MFDKIVNFDPIDVKFSQIVSNRMGFTRTKYLSHILKIKEVMKKKPISIDKNMLAAQALSLMNEKKCFGLEAQCHMLFIS